MNHDIDHEAKPDMTPMIDVVFLMIIFFVCIQFRTLEAKLPAFLPKHKGSSPHAVAPQPNLPVRVELVAAGTRTFAPGLGAGDVDPGTGRAPRFQLVGHQVRWQVGPKVLHDLDAVRHELQRVAGDAQNLVTDAAGGGRRLLPCVIEGQRGTCYEDIARTADACRHAGFVDIEFGGGMGPVR